MILKIGYNINGQKFSDNKYGQNLQSKPTVAPPPKYQPNLSNNDKLSNFNSIGSFIPFTAQKGEKPVGKSKIDSLMYNTNTPAKVLIKKLKEEAKDSGYNEITTMHVIKHELKELDQYIEDLDSGKKDFDEAKQPTYSMYLGATIDNLVSKPELRKEVKPIIKKYIKEADKILQDEKPENVTPKEDIKFSSDLTDAVHSFFKESEKNEVVPFIIAYGALLSPDDVTSDFEKDFSDEINDAVMINHKKMNERTPFSEYEPKAQNILKNLSLGTNIFITYDHTKDNVNNFLDTIKKVNDENNSSTEIVELNRYAKASYFMEKVNQLAKNKSKNYIVAMQPTLIVANDLEQETIKNGVLPMSAEICEKIKNPPSNIKFLLYDVKDNFYGLSNLPVFSSFEEAAIPTLSTAQMIKSFKENPLLMKDIHKNFTKKAIEKTVEASAQIDGVFPEKTQRLMKKIVAYNINKKEINDKDVAQYVKEVPTLFKKNTEETSVEVVFDTGKKMKDFVGKTATQQEASLIAKQIKSNKMGTKGIIVYSQDGSPGSGRRFTAQAIAGEARVPYIEVNTMDFGTKEVDLFGGGALSPEASIKKLFSLVTTQAEANKHKSAVLFVDNFEYFSVGEQVSLYHQKAMAQLLREMDKAQKAGLNILVVGSVSNPKLIGEATMKSFKFIDSIAVTSPAYSTEERAAVLKNTAKREKIKLAGTPLEQENTIKYAAEIASGFPFIYLQNLAKKAASVAVEKGHKGISKADFTEAYLQITTGRASTRKINEHEKLIVTSHECGHATNLQVMNNVAKTRGEKWHVPTKVNFITLDPRGMFGGAVFSGYDANKQVSFETMFSDIVYSFGGNSAEQTFYNMNGSYGISCDMQSVREDAEEMVKVMGLGAKTGKMSIEDGEDLSDKTKEMIEDDERVIIHNGKIVSDLITEIYADFNKEFTEKYAHRVGTGECIINGDDFRQMLNDWKSRQTPEKQHELELCDDMILKIIDCTKKGVEVQKEQK